METNATTIAGGNGRGDQLNQLFNPQGIYVDDEQKTVYLADFRNHRIMKWVRGAKEGIVVAGGQGQGHRFDRLSSPRGVIVNDVADALNQRIMYWPAESKEGHRVLGAYGKGQQSNEFNNRVQRFDVDQG